MGFGELGLDDFVKGFHRDRLLAVPASSLAMTHLGYPLTGAALLGGFAALTWAVSLDSVLAAITGKFSGPVAEGNAKAARAAFAFVRDEREALGLLNMSETDYCKGCGLCTAECPCGAIAMRPEPT